MPASLAHRVTMLAHADAQQRGVERDDEAADYARLFRLLTDCGSADAEKLARYEARRRAADAMAETR